MSARQERRSRRGWWIFGAVVAVVLAWLGLCAWQILRGARQVQQGADQAQVARSEVSGSDLLSEAPLAPLAAAHQHFSAASSDLNQGWLVPLRIVPWLGRQLDSVQSLSSAASEVTGVGTRAVVKAHDILELPHAAGPERVNVLVSLSHLAASTYASLQNVDLGPSNALFGTLAEKHAQFAGDLSRARSGLSHASVVGATVARLLSGPTNYLLLAGNNAEMRSGSGMFLQAGVLNSQDGQLHLGPLTSTGSIPAPPGAVPISGDIAARWGWLLPNEEWRNLGVTPQFDVNAKLATQMWRAVTGQPVDGVVSVDFEAIAQILGVTGPVEADGMTFDSSNVVQFLTSGQYAGESNVAPSEVNAVRHDDLGDLARAALQALEDRPVDLSAMAKALATSAQGRHIMAWSPVARDEAAWQDGGVAGTLHPDTLLASVINRGGNKLDQYLSVSNHLSLTRSGSSTYGTLTVGVDNTAPPGPPSYVLGPYPGLGTAAGEYDGLMSFNVPATATGLGIEGYKTLAAAGPEGPTTVLAAPFDLGPGASRTFVLHFRLPSDHGSLDVMPTARIPPVGWAGTPGQFTDAAPHLITW